MEGWQEGVAECGRQLTPRSAHRMLAAASLLLSDELADFEIEEVLNNLLAQSSGLASHLWERRHDDAWGKSTGELFDLLAAATLRYSQHLEEYMEWIVKLCTSGSYAVLIRKKGLQCLVALSRCTEAGAYIGRAMPCDRMLEALRRSDEPLSCRIPLAELIGSICENHSELIADPELVWRTYCSVLEVNKTTYTLASAVFTGVTGLFSKFGHALPTADINSFAKNILTKYITSLTCEEAVLNLIAKHASLFREVLTGEAGYRRAVFASLAGKHRAVAADAAVAVYAAVATVASSEPGRYAQFVNNLIWTEIWDNTKPYSEVPSFFLRCAWAVADVCRTILDPKVSERLSEYTGRAASSLEFELEWKLDAVRDETAGARWEYDNEAVKLMEKAWWWVSRGEPGSEVALRCLVRLHDRCPGKRRRKLIAHPILNSGGGHGIIGFLINESCQAGNTTMYLSLWNDLFDTQRGTDQVVIDNSKEVFDEFVDCFLSIARVYLEKRDFADESKEKLSRTLLLASHILSSEHVSDWLQECADALATTALDCLRVYGASEGAVCLAATPGVRRASFYKGLSPVRCGEERVLVCVCRAIVTAPPELRALCSDTDVALQIIFSRKDAEPALLSQAVHCLQDLAVSRGTDRKWFTEINLRVEKLARCKSWKGRDARMLRRDVYMFLSKFGSASDSNNNDEEMKVDEDITKSDVLTINLPDSVASYKLELGRVYETVLRSEDSESLWACLLMLCSAAASDAGNKLDGHISRVVYALSRCYSRGELEPGKAPLVERVALWCARPGTADMFAQYISKEKSPGVRKILSNILEQILLQNPHSEMSQQLLAMITDRAISLLASEQPPTRKAGLDVTESIIPALKENNEFSKTHVPDLLTLILNTKDSDSEASFTPLSKYLEEKIVIFEKYKLDALAKDAIQNLFVVEIYDFPAFKSVVKKSLQIFKVINDFIKDDNDIWKMDEFNVLENYNLPICVYILAEAKVIFEWDATISRNVVSFNDFAVLNALVQRGNDAFVDDDSTEFLVEAMLAFLGEYAVYLMEFQYEKTSQILANILTRQPTEILQKCRHQMFECFRSYNKIWFSNIPSCIQKSYTNWFDNLPIKEISDKLKFQCPLQEHRDVIGALKITLRVLNSRNLIETLQTNVDLIKQWPRIIRDIFNGAALSIDRTKMDYLTDALTVALYFANATDVCAMCEDLKFYHKFLAAFGGYLLREPDVLFDERLRSFLPDVVKDFVKFAVLNNLDEKAQTDVIELVDRLWPHLQHSPVASLHGICAELQLLRRRPLPAHARAARWLLGALAQPRASLDERALLMEMLPAVARAGGAGGGSEEASPEYLAALKCYESVLPHRLSELSDRRSPRCFRAVLSALAATQDTHLLKLLLSVAIGDESCGRWRRAIEQCAASLAGCDHIARALYELASSGQQLPRSRLQLLDVMLVPLLQWSTSSYCEQFFSSRLENILSVMSSVPSDLQRVNSVRLDNHLVDYIVAFTLARVMFEKVASESLESCDSALYAGVRARTGGRAWWCVPHVCGLAVTLRGKVAAAPCGEYGRLFQCANYNCLAAAITKRGLLKFYKQLFTPDVWPLVVDCEKAITRWGPLDPKQSAHKKRHNVSVATDADASGPRAGAGPTLSLRRSARTALFLRTLSDNPLQYDLLDTVEEPTCCQSVLLTDSELNDNECAATLSALLCRLAAAAPAGDAAECVAALARALRSDAAPAVRATLAQVICNCKEELKVQSEQLTGALLDVLARRPAPESGLNGLDVAALDTIFFWADPNPTDLDDDQCKLLTDCLMFLLRDLVSARHSSNYVPKIILAKVESLVKIFGASVVMEWEDVWRETVIDTGQNKFAIDAWQTLTKHLHIPSLPSLIADSIDLTKPKSTVVQMSELYGLSLVNCESDADRGDSLKKFWTVLKEVRSKDKAEYVNLMYYAQTGSGDVCDEDNFKIIMGLTSQMQQYPKKKCLKITSKYLSGLTRGSEATSDLFQMLNVSELLVGGDYVQYGLTVARDGIRLMEENARRQIVSQVLEYCGSAQESVRKLAYEALLAALDAMLQTPAGSAPRAAKRARLDVAGSRLLRLSEAGELYERRLLAGLARGLLDPSELICRMTFESIERHLCGHRVSVRFAECAALALVLPSDRRCLADGAHGGTLADHAGGLAVCMRLLMDGMRRAEHFKRTRLQNAALKKNIDSAARAVESSRLLTLSSRFQGSLRSTGAGYARARADTAGRRVGLNNEAADTNVEVPYDDILKAFIDFAANDTEAARGLFLTVFRALLQQDPGLSETFSSLLSCIDVSEVTPTLLEASRLCAAESAKIPGFRSAVARLTLAARGSTSEQLVSLVNEDLTLHGPEHEAMLRWIHTEEDVEMKEIADFTVAGLLEATELLSNWDELTESQKRGAMSGAAPLWTSDDNFSRELHKYFYAVKVDAGKSAWLGRLYSVWQGEGGLRHDDWLRAARAWPVDEFCAGATAEAIEWHGVMKSRDANTDGRTWSELCSRPVRYGADNMAHSAALLMFRSLLCRSTSASGDSDSGAREEAARARRRREAAWTRACVARGAHAPALRCVERNVAGEEMYKSETLSWLLLQLRCQLMKSRGGSDAPRLLERAELSVKAYREYSTAEVVLEMSELIVTMAVDIGIRSCGDAGSVESTLGTVSRTCSDMRSLCEQVNTSEKSQAVAMLARAHAAVASYCDEALEKCDEPRGTERLPLEMLEHAVRAARCDRNAARALVALPVRAALARDARYAATLLDKLATVASTLDGVTLDVIRRMREDAWRHVPTPAALLDVLERDAPQREAWRRRLSALRDPTYALHQLCCRLYKAIEDSDGAAVASLLRELSDDEGASEGGVAYLELEPQRAKLRTIEGIDLSSKPNAIAAKSIVSNLLRQLSRERASMSLADVCPALAIYPGGVTERDRRCLDGLLGVGEGGVVKFDSQLRIITTSIRRPALLRARLADGRARTLLVKSGEDLRSDEACQRAQGYFNSALRGTRRSVCTYKVTPLGSNSGLIEYLDDFATVRALICRSVPDVAQLRFSPLRPADKDLAQLAQPSQRAKRLNIHREMSAKSPPTALRSAIEAECESVEQFIKAKAAFLDSVAAMTVSHWLLGAGDRHLENIMVQPRRGLACGIDWGYVWERRARLAPPELQPARLTANTLCVNLLRRAALESGMQKVLGGLRAEARALHAACSLAFHWEPEYAGRDFQDNLDRLKRKLSGGTVSFRTTLEVLRTSDMPDADVFANLLEDVARNFPEKDSYSVEEQVSSLLQHCTNEDLLAVSRSGWEPWL